MSGYYDSWSANTRKKNYIRRSAHASLDQQGTEHILNRHRASVIPFVPAKSTTPTSPSPLSSTRAGFSLSKFSPALQHPWTRSDVEKGSPIQGRSGVAWRASTHPVAADNIACEAFDKDFDDDDYEDDDEEDDDSDTNTIHVVKQRSTPDARPRHSHTEYEGNIEQLVGDEFSAPDTYLTPMAKSSPALPVSDPPPDNPHSTSTFNARLHPQPIIRALDTPRGKEGRKQRPWSQVIWESPIMDESVTHRQRVYDHAATVGGQCDSYPALTKDLFTQRTPEKVISKTVRINIDAPDTSPITPRQPVRTPERGFSQGATLLLAPATGRREFSHSRKHAHRLSIGSGFYAALEPVNLAAATPTTPKAKRQLVRLPARPQSVFIPTTIQKQGTLQIEDTTRRRRHQSQQLEVGRHVVPIPWVQLAPMSAHDNARTFHGIVTGAPVGSAHIAFETSTSCSALDGTTPTGASKSDTSPVQPPLQQLQPQHRSSQHPYPAFHTPASLMTPVQVPPTQTQQQRGLSHHVHIPPSRFLPTLLESPSSFFFKKPFSSSSSSSPSSAGSPSLQAQEPWIQSSPSPKTTKFSYRHRFQSNTTTPSRTRQTLTTSLTPEKHSPYRHRNRTSAPSASFPSTLVSYESGDLLGIKNSSTVCSTSAASPIVAPGTTLPPGTNAPTGVPILGQASFPIPPNMPTISMTPSCGSIERFPESSTSSPSGGDGPTAEILLEKAGLGDKTGFRSSLPYDHSTHQLHDGVWSSDPPSSSMAPPEYLCLEDGSQMLVQKSHVAVYEINARWGSRLAMVLVSLGGLLCAVSGGLCAEHNCRELQFCEDSHAAHGNWCGPSGVDSAPYLLTVGFSMWTFGLYALSHLRTPTSRLVGYSEIDQVL